MASIQGQYVEQAIITTTPAIQNATIMVPPLSLSHSVSSTYTNAFLNLENLHSTKMEVVSMLCRTTLGILHIPNREQTHQEAREMYYPRFTKAIIHHFITKNKSISMRNGMFMNTVEDDSILGPVRFVSKADDYQVYGALLPEAMTNQKMRDSPAYKTYLAFATGAASPTKARKFKKPASPSRKRTLVIVEEEPKPAKKVAPSKNGLGDGAGFQPKVPDEPKGKSIDTHEATGDDEDVQDSDDDPQPADDERTDSENQETNDDDE
ncbi:hypothetical protein Tco_0397971, partial [Tanacetum coccineum]